MTQETQMKKEQKSQQVSQKGNLAKKGRPPKEKTEALSQLRQRVQMLLSLPVADAEQKEVLRKAGIPVRYCDNLQMIAWNLYQKALSGDLGAVRELRELTEEAALPGKSKGKKTAREEREILSGQVIIIDDIV